MPLGSSDAFRWYNVGKWADYALAVPCFSNDFTSQNNTIRYLCDVMGRNLQAVMFHTDSRLRTPPSINTITRVHKLCTRVRAILASRSVPAGTPNMESAHALPSPEDFFVYPVPYFRVRNQWMKEYAGLTLLALTEAMQHQENAKTLEISTAFSGLVGQYVKRIYVRLATELLQVDPVAANADNFTLSQAQLDAYDPSKWFTSTELIDTVPTLDDWQTEDDLQVLTDGIPTSMLPNLPFWPTTANSSALGAAAGSSGSPAPGPSFAPAPSV